jgi:phosphatidate cytidylyltransferase
MDLRNLFLRVAVAAAGIPLLFFAVLSGGWWVVSLAVVLTVVSAWEWAEMASLRRMPWLYAVAIVGPFALVIAHSVCSPQWWVFIAIILVMVSIVGAMTGPWKETGAVRSVGATFLSIFYLSLFGLMIPVSQGIGGVSAHDGSRLVMAGLFMVWLCDTFAYFGGTTLGKTKLAPSLSPNKSWEGAAFGFFGSIAGGVLAYHMLSPHALGLVELACVGAVVGVVGQLGDLAESLFKRDLGVKDSSNLLLGHGGVLDRFDSYLFTLPVLWAWLLIRPDVMGLLK